MLKTLNIENIAVIEKAQIEFTSGFNAMTGETGAGKSIIVDSINAILGERTSKELVRNDATSASVTALFEDVNTSVENKIKDMGYEPDEDGTLVISRSISAQGKSSCKINGRPCTVSMLRDLSTTLVNIHGQHDSQTLLNPDDHFKFVDLMGDDVDVYNDYKSNFKHLLEIRKKLKGLTFDADEKDRRLELLDYQINEISSAEIKVGEIEELNRKRDLILNSQSINQSLNSILSAINGDEEIGGIQVSFSSSIKEINDIKSSDEDLALIVSKLDDLNEKTEQLKDIIVNKLENTSFNENELENIEQRLDMYYHFQNKYGKTEQDMLNYLSNAQEERALIVNSDEQIERLNQEYDDVLDKTVKSADILSCYRKSLGYSLEQDIKKELEYLDMPKVQFVVEFKRGNLSINGYDKIEFLISTNPGEPPKPLSKIASGGELSRIMLAIKNILAKNDSIQTLIFDEIDTGVSGRASRKIGLKLKSVSKHSQVICVTHSAQIASVADNHLLIEKMFENDKTYTSVKSLGYEDRLNELARIMGGMEITDSLLLSAKELLNYEI